jgi:hypothetical protein
MSEKIKAIYPKPLCGLSLGATGVIGKMINCPELDYVSAEQLAKNVHEPASELMAYLNELLEQHYLLKVGETYAVNKYAIPSMVYVD